MALPMRGPVEVPYRSRQNGAPTELSARINQIFVQKGPFRNVTLERLANDPEDDASDEENGDDDQIGGSIEDQTAEGIAKQRFELYNAITQLTIDVNSALDMVSMVLSQKSFTATGTFSAGLKGALAPGMLDSLVLPEGHPEPNVKPLSEISTGWKTSAFESASKHLLAASERVRKEADMQSSFWSQVAGLTEQGWKVSRHPSNKKIAGVHFGFAGSAPQFRGRGFAVLRQDQDSNIYLDKATLSRHQKRVSVTVIRDGKITGKHSPSIASGTGVLSQVINARDNLFEEELIHELGREARFAANLGIVARENTVEFPLDSHTKVSLSLTRSKPNARLDSGPDNALARFIALSIRSLLLQSFEKAEQRRSEFPQSLSSAQSGTMPPPRISRNLVALYKHSNAVEALTNQFHSSVRNPLGFAGLIADLSEQQEEYNDDAPAAVPTGPYVSRFKLTMPTKETLTITITTNDSAPDYGQTYTTTAPITLSSPDSLSRHLEDLVVTDLAALVLAAYKAKNGASNASFELAVAQDAFVLQLQHVAVVVESGSGKRGALLWSKNGHQSMGGEWEGEGKLEEKLRDALEQKLGLEEFVLLFLELEWQRECGVLGVFSETEMQFLV
ncbi:Mediator of RNA polymerase II transcription subunit 17 [Cyphellophora attinorum]|uniref:Mediator of RNA polymerase II transcription subunit 17 n=1 Tax=Cyphellophora attinorum TaxID=1664694 RepID=A0A0N0NM23_9EURO|nr:Mediator of RNA polymerase II transcription subunit 17 [Phialophora attinorum]KPI39848.1 Mediator of RNA polymerase II transcription subunit 17 [Phialophora attinorum]